MINLLLHNCPQQKMYSCPPHNAQLSSTTHNAHYCPLHNIQCKAIHFTKCTTALYTKYLTLHNCPQHKMYSHAMHNCPPHTTTVHHTLCKTVIYTKCTTLLYTNYSCYLKQFFIALNTQLTTAIQTLFAQLLSSDIAQFLLLSNYCPRAMNDCPDQTKKSFPTHMM